MNDLCIVCKNTEPVLFADDTNLFSSGSNAISLLDGVNNDLAIIAEWLKVSKLSLNIRKHISCVSQLKIRLLHVYHYKLMGKPLLNFFNQNSWVWLLTINWVGKIIYLLCVERLLVVLGFWSRLEKYSGVNLWSVCITRSYILIWYIVIKFGDLRIKQI